MALSSQNDKNRMKRAAVYDYSELVANYDYNYDDEDNKTKPTLNKDATLSYTLKYPTSNVLGIDLKLGLHSIKLLFDLKYQFFLKIFTFSRFKNIRRRNHSSQPRNRAFTIRSDRTGDFGISGQQCDRQEYSQSSARLADWY